MENVNCQRIVELTTDDIVAEFHEFNPRNHCWATYQNYQSERINGHKMGRCESKKICDVKRDRCRRAWIVCTINEKAAAVLVMVKWTESDKEKEEEAKTVDNPFASRRRSYTHTRINQKEETIHTVAK